MRGLTPSFLAARSACCPPSSISRYCLPACLASDATLICSLLLCLPVWLHTLLLSSCCRQLLGCCCRCRLLRCLLLTLPSLMLLHSLLTLLLANISCRCCWLLGLHALLPVARPPQLLRPAAQLLPQRVAPLPAHPPGAEVLPAALPPVLLLPLPPPAPPAAQLPALLPLPPPAPPAAQLPPLRPQPPPAQPAALPPVQPLAPPPLALPGCEGSPPCALSSVRGCKPRCSIARCRSRRTGASGEWPHSPRQRRCAAHAAGWLAPACSSRPRVGAGRGG